uniref:I-set domain-containing protein n=1 Tax=Rhabditophanes sp. KR3021 TaxID=114890 RepID=A0AC35TSN2_9BILA
MVCPPFFEKAPSVAARPDGTVLFECLCNANPEPKITWKFKGNEITPDNRICMKIKKIVGKWAVTMTLKNPTQADQGY